MITAGSQHPLELRDHKFKAGAFDPQFRAGCLSGGEKAMGRELRSEGPGGPSSASIPRMEGQETAPYVCGAVEKEAEGEGSVSERGKGTFKEEAERSWCVEGWGWGWRRERELGAQTPPGPLVSQGRCGPGPSSSPLFPRPSCRCPQTSSLAKCCLQPRI